MKKLTAAFGMMLALTACSYEQAPPLPVSHVLPPKIALNVRAVNLADRSGIQPPNSPYNTNHFTPTIAEAIKQWAGDRLQAVGQNGQAIIVIKDASLTAQPLAVQDGFDSWFTRQQGLKYMGHADVSIEASGSGGFAVTDASASRVLTLPENPTAMEKQDAYYTMLNGLMKDLGENLDSGIQAHMSNFITTAPIYGSTAVLTAAPRAPVQSTVNQDVTAPEASSSFDTSPSTIEAAPAPASVPSHQGVVIPLSGGGR